MVPSHCPSKFVECGKGLQEPDALFQVVEILDPRDDVEPTCYVVQVKIDAVIFVPIIQTTNADPFAFSVAFAFWSARCCCHDRFSDAIRSIADVPRRALLTPRA